MSKVKYKTPSFSRHILFHSFTKSQYDDLAKGELEKGLAKGQAQKCLPFYLDGSLTVLPLQPHWQDKMPYSLDFAVVLNIQDMCSNETLCP